MALRFEIMTPLSFLLSKIVVADEVNVFEKYIDRQRFLHGTVRTYHLNGLRKNSTTIQLLVDVLNKAIRPPWRNFSLLFFSLSIYFSLLCKKDFMYPSLVSVKL